MKTILAISVFAFFCVYIGCTQKNPHFVDDRNTIVHLFEWKWKDIAKECERFLSKKKYAGVQISPPNEYVIVKNPSRPWWERYQPVSYTLTSRSGDESALADMIRRCNKVGIRIYVDITVNDMAGLSGIGTAGNIADASSKSYPGIPYTNDNFHQTCSIDFSNATSIRDCELAGLKDLNQSQRYVRDKIRGYMNHLINLGVAGFRIDAAKHMWPDDLRAIFDSLDDLNTNHGFKSGARAYVYQEIIDTGTDPVKNTDYASFGRVIEFKHGKELSRCFKGNNPLHWLISWGTGWGLIDENNALVMIDNHDTQREEEDIVLTYKNSKQYKAAIAFMMAHPYEAHTRVMSSYAFDSFDQGPPNRNGDIISPGFTGQGTCTNGWVCEHRWRQIFNAVEFRSVTTNTRLTNWWDNGDNQIAFSRGNKGFVAFTLSGDINRKLQTGLSAGGYCDIISGSVQNGTCTGKSIVVDGDGYAWISLRAVDEDAVLAIHVNAKL